MPCAHADATPGKSIAAAMATRNAKAPLITEARDPLRRLHERATRAGKIHCWPPFLDPFDRGTGADPLQSGGQPSSPGGQCQPRCCRDWRSHATWPTPSRSRRVCAANPRPAGPIRETTAKEGTAGSEQGQTLGGLPSRDRRRALALRPIRQRAASGDYLLFDTADRPSGDSLARDDVRQRRVRAGTHDCSRRRSGSRRGGRCWLIDRVEQASALRRRPSAVGGDSLVEALVSPRSRAPRKRSSRESGSLDPSRKAPPLRKTTGALA